jgi:hypothetical protein
MPAQVQKAAFDFQSQTVTIDLCVIEGDQLRLLLSLPFADGVRECNYTDTAEFEAMYGSNRLPQDFTDSVFSFEGSLTFERYWTNYIEDVLEDLGIGYAMARLNIASNLYRGGSIPARQDVLWSCKVKSWESAFKQGPEAMMVPLSLTPLNIYRNGRDPFGNTL